MRKLSSSYPWSRTMMNTRPKRLITSVGDCVRISTASQSVNDVVDETARFVALPAEPAARVNAKAVG
jgi:hypothetical protein